MMGRIARWGLVIVGVVATVLFAAYHVVLGIAVKTPPTSVIVSTAPWGEDALTARSHAGAVIFQGCASCHHADAIGRADGSVPRLAGQPAAVLARKLEKLQTGEVWLPVMTPFARALTEEQVVAVADWLANLPQPERAPGEAAYQISCAGCHGEDGQGRAETHAPGLCHQHADYLHRRIEEIQTNRRGDADPAMQQVVAGLPTGLLGSIVAALSEGRCQPPNPGAAP